MSFGRGLLSFSLANASAEEEEEEDEPLPSGEPLLLSAPKQLGLGLGLGSSLLKWDEVEEEEEDMPIEPMAPGEMDELPISQDFIDAQRSIEENSFDTDAWKVYLEEASRKKSGVVSIPEAYSKFLEVFPRSATHWRTLIGYHISVNALSEAERTAVRANLSKCRNIHLWICYIDLMQRMNADKKRMEEIFEECVKNVGMSSDSGIIWRRYLDSISEIRDPAHLPALRKVYQRALVVPMDCLDTLLAEYEKLERRVGEHLADQILPEVQEKANRAKAIYKDRKKLMSACDLDHLAVLPNSFSSELQQLEAWNKMLK
jgi:cleavage stimulation factor subunit 3